MHTQYDDIAANYRSINSSLRARQMVRADFDQRTGNVAGLSVLDLACGTGDSTRTYKRNGAAYIVGVDISEEMIELARQDEKQQPLGIEYRVCDAQHLGKIGDFDLIVAAYLLNYASTKKELLNMCQVIYDNLKPDCRFVTLNFDVRLSCELYGNENYKKYGLLPQIVDGHTLSEGAVLRLIMFEGEKQVHFDYFYLHPRSYEHALQEVGFKHIKWHSTALQPEFVRDSSKEFFQFFIDNPINVVIECQK